MIGNIMAFQNFRNSKHGFLHSLFVKSEWIGFKNFEFLFKTRDAWVITRNTVAYNVIFIVLTLVVSVTFAIMLAELRNTKLRKVYQTAMFFPYFLSWVIVGYFVYGFLSVDKGLINDILGRFGHEPIRWYAEPKYWPFILVFMNLWKNVGYQSVVYLATIVGFNQSLYEAAMIDGANKWKQIKYITLPLLKPIMIILTLLAIGRIFYADFGLFYQVPRNSGVLYSVTNVIDTYVFRGLMVTGDIGMSSAAGLYQSLVGFIFVLISNYIVKKIDPDYGLF